MCTDAPLYINDMQVYPGYMKTEPIDHIDLYQTVCFWSGRTAMILIAVIRNRKKNQRHVMLLQKTG